MLSPGQQNGGFYETKEKYSLGCLFDSLAIVVFSYFIKLY